MSDRRSSHRERRGGRIRVAVAREAARLMVQEGVDQYFDAKRIAARRVLGSDEARFRPGDLPGNGEIQAQILELVALSEGRDRTRRLFAMRAVALTVMRELEPWSPRLIGSVWSGHARRGSDIDIHVFGDLDQLMTELTRRRWAFEAEEVLIRVPTGFRAFHHLHLLDRPFPVELSVYDLSERREVTRSSVDGKPIDRVSAARLEALLWEEHEDDWAAFRRSGRLDFEEGPEPGEFDGLLRELGGEER